MQLFYKFFGLQLNCAKSELFSSGVSKDQLMEIQQHTGFKFGTLPVRYLGVPLITRRLSEKDCIPLVDRITIRIKHWASKFLSYAGRFQLIQTVLYSIQQYWCRNFILPQSVIKRINQICSQFFWKGRCDSAKGAKSELEEYQCS